MRSHSLLPYCRPGPVKASAPATRAAVESLACAHAETEETSSNTRQSPRRCFAKPMFCAGSVRAGACLHQEGAEAPWLRGDYHHGWAPLIRRSDGPTGQSREAGGRPLGEQQGREQPFALPPTRAGDVEIPADEVAANVRFSPRLVPQPLRLRPSPHRSTDLQAPPLRRLG